MKQQFALAITNMSKGSHAYNIAYNQVLLKNKMVWAIVCMVWNVLYSVLSQLWF